MGGKILLGVAFLLVVFSLLTVYYLEPFSELEFSVMPSNYNFSLSNYTTLESMQFYENLRFPETTITYQIYGCGLRKTQDMEDAFTIMENLTILDFNPVSSEEQISITCNETNRFEGGMFIAGEGGPSRVVRAGDFNVIFTGTILLIRDSNCERPNIAIHELLHVLGFKHSDNPNNIMYNFTQCKQIIGEDIVQLINDLYSIESKPDLMFDSGNLSAMMHGRYLDLNITVKNNGLKNAASSIIGVDVDGKRVKDIIVGELKVGNGRVISIQNIWITKLNPEKIELIIETHESELDTENNIVVFEMGV